MNRDKYPAFTPEGKHRILSMIKESLNATFVICNTDFKIFGKEEFTDIFNQILPTAIVLNTGYWPFYKFSDNKYLRLCVCKQFMIQCQHKLAKHRSPLHGIHLPLERSNRKVSQDVARPLRYSVQILETVPQLPPGYSLSFRIVLRVTVDERRSEVIETEYFEVNERYTLLQQYKQIGIFNYNFPPHPTLEEQFTNVFNCAEWFHFDQRITNGFTIESNEVQTWTLCAAGVLDNRMRNDLSFLPDKQMEITKKKRKRKVNHNIKIIGSKSNPVRNDGNILIDNLVKLQRMLELLSNDLSVKLNEENCSGKSEISERSTQEICSY